MSFLSLAQTSIFCEIIKKGLMLCATYSTVLQILEIRPLLCSRNVNEFLHSILYGIKWLVPIIPYKTNPSYHRDPLYTLYMVQLREHVCAQEEYGIIKIHMDQVISVEHSITGEAEDIERKKRQSYSKPESLCEQKIHDLAATSL